MRACFSRLCSFERLASGSPMVQPEVRQTAVVGCEHGLHLRPVKHLSDLAQSFASSIQIVKEDSVFDGKSLWELLTLNASCGTPLLVVARGDDASDAATAIVKVIETKVWQDHSTKTP